MFSARFLRHKLFLPPMLHPPPITSSTQLLTSVNVNIFICHFSLIPKCVHLIFNWAIHLSTVGVQLADTVQFNVTVTLVNVDLDVRNLINIYNTYS